MTENLAIVPQPQQHLNPAVRAQSDEFAMMKQKAGILVESGFLPKGVDTWQKAAAIMMRGRELNLSDWTALQHISVIHGNPTIDGQLALALVQRSGLLEEYVILRSDTKACTIRMKRKGQTAFECTVTIEEAATMKTTEYQGEKKVTVSLTQSYGWQQQPKTHLFYFNIKQITKRLFSDVLNGMAGSINSDLMIEDIEEATVADALFGDGEENGQTTPANPTLESPAPQPDNPSKAESVEGEIVEDEDDGLPPIGVKPTETVTASQPPPNVYICDRLKVEVAKDGARTYTLSVKGSETRISTTNPIAFEGVKVSSKSVVDLAPAIYPLIPLWTVTADKNVDGWDIQKIVTDDIDEES